MLNLETERTVCNAVNKPTNTKIPIKIIDFMILFFFFFCKIYCYFFADSIETTEKTAAAADRKRRKKRSKKAITIRDISVCVWYKRLTEYRNETIQMQFFEIRHMRAIYMHRVMFLLILSTYHLIHSIWYDISFKLKLSMQFMVPITIWTWLVANGFFDERIKSTNGPCR